MKSALRILHLEDNATDAELMQLLLHQEGLTCEVIRIESRSEFEAALDQGELDLVISDFTLPSYDGRSALALAQARRPEVPFIFFSGTIGEEAAIDAMKCGATDYVLKERPSRLAPVVRRALCDAQERAARRRMETALQAAEERRRGIYESSKDPIAYYTLDGRLEDVNEAAVNFFGYSRDELLTKTHQDLTPPEYQHVDADIMQEVLLTREPAEYEKEYVRKDGVRIPVALTLFVVKGGTGEPIGLAAIIKDVTDRKRKEEQILELAYHDGLTGLPNRRLFSDRLEVALMHARRKHQYLGILILDLDRFKAVNDELGHTKGDLLLQGVAARLAASVRSGDTVARVGSDEFSILLPELSDPDDATTVAWKVLDALSAPFVLDEQRFTVTASAGISLFPADGKDADTLMINADGAMHHAKKQGGNTYHLCTTEMKAQASERHSLERGLRQAVENHEFLIYYQPVLDLKTGSLAGMEALVRWKPSNRNMILPGDFIEVAEESGLIVPIGLWVLRTACAQTKAWHLDGHSYLRLAVNLSARQCWRGEFVTQVQAVMQETGLNPEALDLEITERIVLQNLEFALSVLGTLNRLGIGLAMDDFGTGYSSIGFLKQMPVNSLKIDQSFVQGIGNKPDDTAIVRVLIALGHSLGLKVVAEGVETPEQLDFLRVHQCDLVQGYLVSPPLPPKAFEQFLVM